MNLKSLYQREIERKGINNLIFSVSVAIVVILLTIFFGVKPTFLAVKKNREYKEELTKIKTNMENKLSQIEEEKMNIRKMEENIEILNKKIPQDINFQSFLEMLVNVTAESRFIIKQVKNENYAEQNTTIPFKIILLGKVENLAELLKDLEVEMPRFVSINKIKTQQQKDEDLEIIEINMDIYILR